MAKPDWDEIRDYYITNPDCSLNDIVAKFKVTKSATADRSVKEEWVKKREAFHNEVRIAVEQKNKEIEIQRRLATNAKHNEMYDRLLKAASGLIDTFEEAQRTGKYNRGATAANLAYLAEVVQKAQKGQRTALDMDREDETDNSPQINFVIEGITLEDI